MVTPVQNMLKQYGIKMSAHKSKIQNLPAIILVSLVLILSLISESCLSTTEENAKDEKTLEAQFENILNNLI